MPSQVARQNVVWLLGIAASGLSEQVLGRQSQFGVGIEFVYANQSRRSGQSIFDVRDTTFAVNLSRSCVHSCRQWCMAWSAVSLPGSIRRGCTQHLFGCLSAAHELVSSSLQQAIRLFMGSCIGSAAESPLH